MFRLSQSDLSSRPDYIYRMEQLSKNKKFKMENDSVIKNTKKFMRN